MKAHQQIAVLLSLAICALTAPVGHAQSVPSLINYQGKLTDASGTPLPNGTYSVAVRLWSKKDNAQFGNTLVWGQEYNVAVINGIFNVILGAPGGTPVTNAAVNDLSFAFNDAERYFGLTVTKGTNGIAIPGAVEIVPRQRLLSAPYAVRANFADTAQTVLTSPIPHGVITLWSGSIATVPSGWVLCDGSNGTPDLRNRFVVGADADSGGMAQTSYTGSPTQTGGNVHHTHSGKTGYSADWYSPGINLIDRYPNDWDKNACIDHDHPFTTGNESVVPVVYFALAYIMKL